jgi:hypothetical protein
LETQRGWRDMYKEVGKGVCDEGMKGLGAMKGMKSGL